MEERKYYPLSDEQEGLVLLASVFPAPNILYLLTRIDFVSDIDEERLLKAIRITDERLPYCRVQLHQQDEETVVQYLREGEPDPVSVYDLSESDEEELEKLILQWRQEPFPNNQRETQLYRFRLIRMPGGKHVLHFVVHHFIMDAYAMMYTIQYLDRVYTALSRGEELPAPGMEPWKLLEEERSYFSSARAEKNAAWWLSQYETEPSFTSVNGLGSPEFVEGKRYGRAQNFEQLYNDILTIRIPAEFVKKVDDAAAVQKVSPQVYYMMAMRSFLGRVSGTEDVSVLSPMALRSTKVQRQSGMSIARANPVRMTLSEDLPFAEAVRKLADRENEIYRHAWFNYEKMKPEIYSRFDTEPGCTYESVWLTYQPYFDMSKSELQFRARLLSSGFVPIPLYLLIEPQDTSGDLYADYSYALGYTKPESLYHFHDFMLKFLEAAAKEPDKRLGDLIDQSI